MKNLDPQFIDTFTRKAGRYMRAVRHVQMLEKIIPKSVPSPTEITLARRPYGLEITWQVKWPGKVVPLRDQLSALNISGKWNVDLEDNKKSLTCRGRLYGTGTDKDSFPVILRIKIADPGDD